MKKIIIAFIAFFMILSCVEDVFNDLTDKLNDIDIDFSIGNCLFEENEPSQSQLSVRGDCTVIGDTITFKSLVDSKTATLNESSGAYESNVGSDKDETLTVTISGKEWIGEDSNGDEVVKITLD